MKKFWSIGLLSALLVSLLVIGAQAQAQSTQPNGNSVASAASGRNTYLPIVFGAVLIAIMVIAAIFTLKGEEAAEPQIVHVPATPATPPIKATSPRDGLLLGMDPEPAAVEKFLRDNPHLEYALCSTVLSRQGLVFHYLAVRGEHDSVVVKFDGQNQPKPTKLRDRRQLALRLYEEGTLHPVKNIPPAVEPANRVQ